MNRIFIITFIFSATIYSSEVNDPFENINRKTFEFNENLDEKILKPTAKFYSKFPPRIKNGITNFFNNLEEVDTCVNQLLQGKPKNLQMIFLDSLLTQLLVWLDLLMWHQKWA